jgi:hypothetical protein
MGKNINNINNPQSTISDDSLIYVGIPGGVNPDPFTDATITAVLLKKPLQDQIDDNETDIIDHELRITQLENGSTKRLDTGETGNYTFTQNADSEIEKIYIKLDGGSPTIRIGTTLNGEELVSDQVITSQYKKDINFSKGFAAASRTIYVTISGGSLDIAFYS